MESVQVREPNSREQVSGPAAGTLMTKEYVQALGRVAYIWGWPLVNMGNRSIAFSKLPAPGLIGGVLPAAFNSVEMLTDYVSPEQRAVACPNQDVAYGFGVSQLDQGPLVLQVPDFGDRFWVFALYDQRTDEFSSLGKAYGTKPGFYLIVAPGWQGEVPAGITAVLRSTTDMMLTVPRVFMDDTAEDRAAIQPSSIRSVFTRSRSSPARCRFWIGRKHQSTRRPHPLPAQPRPSGWCPKPSLTCCRQ